MGVLLGQDVMYQQERPAHLDAGQQRPFGIEARRARQHEVLGRNKVKRRRVQRDRNKPGMDPGDFHARLLGMLGRTLERDARDVEGRHVPATVGEPDGIGAFPAADVQCATGIHVGHLGHQGAIRFPPHIRSCSA